MLNKLFKGNYSGIRNLNPDIKTIQGSRGGRYNIRGILACRWIHLANLE